MDENHKAGALSGSSGERAEGGANFACGESHKKQNAKTRLMRASQDSPVPPTIKKQKRKSFENGRELQGGSKVGWVKPNN